MIVTPLKKYRILYVDCPWRYRDKMKDGERGAGFKYKTMTLKELEAMREQIDRLAHEDCVMFLWATLPMLPEAFQLLKAWDFKYRTTAFVWVKTTTGVMSRLQKAIRKAAELAGSVPILRRLGVSALVEALPKALDAAGLIVVGLAFGGGHWTRANAEICFLATRGKNTRVSASVPQVVIAPVTGEHSEKPDEVRTRIVQLMGDLPRMEMFCRHAPEGWDTHGDEVGKLEKKGETDA